jgi:hypothetical protein
MTSVYDISYAESTVIDEGLCKNLLANETHKLRLYYLSECLGKYAKNYIYENPGKFMKKLYLFTVDYWLFPNLEWYQRNIRTPQLRLGVLWFFFVFSVIGFLISLQKFKEFIPFYLIILGIWFSYAITVFLGRYKSSVAPFNIIFAAAGIYGLWYIISKNNK